MKIVNVHDFLDRPLVQDYISGVEFSLPLENTRMGVEVEIDQDSSVRAVFPENFSPEWDSHADGSLVDGREYTLTQPLKGKRLVDAIYRLYLPPTKVGRTYTGSTHIHMDMLDGTSLEVLRTMVLMAYAFESVLYYAGDSSRQWCGYANRLTSAPADMIEQIMALNNKREFSRSMDRNGRYYGLNLAALNKYGSVEFRYFPTAESPEELLRWVKLVQLFKKAAIEVGTVDNLISLLDSPESYNTFVNTYFSEYKEEVDASISFNRVNALMNKALVISKTKNKTPRRTYSKSLVTGKYNKLFAKENKKCAQKAATGGLAAFCVSDPHAPSTREAVEAAHCAGNTYFSLIFLVHNNGYIYWARNEMARSDWSPLENIVHSPELYQHYLQALPELYDFILSLAEPLRSEALARLEINMRAMDTSQGSQVAPVEDPVYEEQYDPEDDDDYEQEEPEEF